MLFSNFVYKYTLDSLKGNFKDMITEGEKPKKSVWIVAFQAKKNQNTQLPLLSYALRIGVEMHIINTVSFISPLSNSLKQIRRSDRIIIWYVEFIC